MAAKIFRLPASTEFSAEQALSDALKDDLYDVLIVGYNHDVSLYIRSSKMTCAEALFMANKAMRWAESGGQL